MSRHAAANFGSNVASITPVADTQPNAPRIPIPGHAAAIIFEALKSMAMHAGEVAVTIRKERINGGGYAYLVAKTYPPVRR